MTSPIRALSVETRDGLNLHAEWRQQESARATLVLCHGIGEHSARYTKFLDQLASAGIATLCFDQRGHGRSAGRRGHVDHFGDYLDDLHRVLGLLKPAAANRPAFLFGHSMGGVVVTQYLLRHGPRHPLQGAVLSSPGFVPAVRVPVYKRLLSQILLPLAPKLRFSTGIRAQQLCRHTERQRQFDADPMTFSQVSVRWYAEFQRAAAECLELAPQLRLPLYVCVGAADSVVSPDGARQFIEAASSRDKTLQAWDGLLHEPLNEAEGERVGRAIVDWILARCG